MNFTKLILLVTLDLLFLSCHSQSVIKYQGIEFETGKIAYKNNDTVTYIYSKSEFSSEKPHLIFLQGSLPRPIIFDINDSTIHVTPLTNFNITRLIKNFNVFVISRAFTPLRKAIKELNSRYLYVPDLDSPNCYDTNYQKSNYLDYSSNRISFFVNFIEKKYKTKNKNIVLLGHSQGAIEAAKVAAINNKITVNILLSVNTFGRIQSALLSNRVSYVKGVIDSSEYITERNRAYEYWKETVSNPEVYSCFGDPSKTEISFSKSIIPDLLNSNTKVFLGVGSLEASSYLVDMIPLYFIERKKEIPTIKIYEGLDHNFFPLLKNGEPDYRNGKWGIVMDDIINWFELNSN